MNVTLEQIKERTEEVGDCWIWQRGITGSGYPEMKIMGRPCKLVRRMVVELDGRKPEKRQPVVATCNDPLCVNPKHLQLSSIKAVSQAKAAAGGWKGKARGAKIAAAKREQCSKINMDAAREIRMSNETGPVLAERYGVDRSLINRIKRNEAWKDYTNPFAGLMGLGA